MFFGANRLNSAALPQHKHKQFQIIAIHAHPLRAGRFVWNPGPSPNNELFGAEQTGGTKPELL